MMMLDVGFVMLFLAPIAAAVQPLIDTIRG